MLIGLPRQGRMCSRVGDGQHNCPRTGGGQQDGQQDQQACERSPERVSTAMRHRGYLVILPIVVISSSTLWRWSVTSPEANAAATQ